jgi:hypothetical protein
MMMETTMEVARLMLYMEYAAIGLVAGALIARLLTPYSYRVELGRQFRHYVLRHD